MTKTCYLHIGAPKTGSTSIQAWFHRNKTELERQGILYPGDERRHNALLSMVHNSPKDLRFHWQNDRKSLEDIASYQSEHLEQMFADIEKSPAEIVLLSNEVFIGQGKKLDIPELENFLRRHFQEIKIICYVRDPVKAMVSRAQEQIKSGVRTYEAVINKSQLMPIESIRFYQTEFGRENVIVRNFDEIVKTSGDVVRDMARFLIPSIDLSGCTDSKHNNTSLTLEAILILSGLNRNMSVAAQTNQRFLQISDVRSIGSTKFGLPRESILGVRERLLEQYGFIRDVLGIDYLIPDFDAIENPSPNWDGDTMEQVALSMNKLAKTRKKRQ